MGVLIITELLVFYWCITLVLIIINGCHRRSLNMVCRIYRVLVKAVTWVCEIQDHNDLLASVFNVDAVKYKEDVQPLCESLILIHCLDIII